MTAFKRKLPTLAVFLLSALLGMVLFVYALHLAGKMFGGHGSLDDVLAGL